MALTKADIVEAVQSEIGFTRHQATNLVESLIEHIKSKLEVGEDALISGFGKFCVRQKGKRRVLGPYASQKANDRPV